ncbi:hypothetical protein [Vibrio sp. PID23_8]|uniref:hypothetical protein n=1 Tax=Vibrio sp. PID23_8 TaxID=1583767 RepID=UPI000E68FFED|nr:hypothetical protein [Vibrio sp. PID23_8]RIZ56578.1 hypothetical protein AK966_00115 [Vibrio sp. PID23_8]
MMAVKERLETAKTEGQTAQSPYTTEDKMYAVHNRDGRYLVRIIPSDYDGDSGTIGKPGDQTYWPPTYTQLEYADSEPEMICKAVGIPPHV